MAEIALIESEQNLKMQNMEYLALNEEYQTLNEELEAKVKHIENINAELIISRNKAEEADRLKSAFLANMSHEIRTPLNSILGFSGLLKNNYMDAEKAGIFVDIINSSGQQLLTIINDILDISKIEAGQIEIVPGPLSVADFLREMHQQFLKMAELKNLNLVLNTGFLDQNPEITTDENRLRQILGNLLNNAIKFTHCGKVEFGILIKENFIEFYVEDTGIGISPENQEIIFKPFRQIKSSNTRLYGGNGLGLSISKALVEKLGGTIEISSEQKKGSIFTFTIPYTEKKISPSDIKLSSSGSDKSNEWK
ncbi:MAG: hybrid sensor histidine kinase/response regulator, partial [Bacteroidales bacterium]|nr:hybrid sensor histidine kinase/response regulator [Bacteroidales bacterium]